MASSRPFALRYFLGRRGKTMMSVSPYTSPTLSRSRLAPNTTFRPAPVDDWDVLSASGVGKGFSALPLGLPELLYACLLCGEADVMSDVPRRDG